MSLPIYLGDIVGDMHTADRERIGMPDVVIEINREIGGSFASCNKDKKSTTDEK